MRPVRVYLAGPAGAGKTETARWLSEHHGFHRVSLGDICRAETIRRGWPADRFHLQAAGDHLRAGDPARLAALALQEASGQGDVVIDGVRLMAEGEYLRARGVIGVRLEAPEAVRRARLHRRDGAGDVPEHETETEAARVPADFVWSTDPIGDGSALRVLVARVAALHASRYQLFQAGRRSG